MVDTEQFKSLQRVLSKGGVLRSMELEKKGFSRDQIRKACEGGVIQRVSRGLYTLPDAELSNHQSLIEVCKKVPRARICLLSALAFHEVGTQMPHEVWIAIGPKDRKPADFGVNLRINRFSADALNEGVETHLINGCSIHVYSVAKTIVDLFRYRNKVGLDVVLEALKDSWENNRFTIQEIVPIAKKCRIYSVMSPYLDLLLA